MTKRKRTNNDLQNSTQKIKYQVTRIPLKLGVNSCAPEGSILIDFLRLIRYFGIFKRGTIFDNLAYCLLIVIA
jgi:hypothetical protein